MFCHISQHDHKMLPVSKNPHLTSCHDMTSCLITSGAPTVPTPYPGEVTTGQRL